MAYRACIGSLREMASRHDGVHGGHQLDKLVNRLVALTASTVMQRTHTPISIWFWAAYLVSSQTPGMSAVQFQRQLGLTRYETAVPGLYLTGAATFPGAGIWGASGRNCATVVLDGLT